MFQDVYPWAGEIRTVGIEKEGEGFLPPEHASFVVNGAARLMREDGMLAPGMDNARWASLLADGFNDVNDAHPFREGNGRTQRTYFNRSLRPVARRSTGPSSPRSRTSLSRTPPAAATSSRCAPRSA